MGISSIQTAGFRPSTSSVASADSNDQKPKIFSQERPYGGKLLTLMSCANRALSKLCSAVSRCAGNTDLGHMARTKAKDLKLDILRWTRDSALSKWDKGTEHARVSSASKTSRDELQANLRGLSTKIHALGEKINEQQAKLTSSQEQYTTFMNDRKTNQVSAQMAAMENRVKHIQDALASDGHESLSISLPLQANIDTSTPKLAYVQEIPFDDAAFANQQHPFTDFQQSNPNAAVRLQAVKFSDDQ